ncbi:hypothetical protein EGW08_009990 [Elysia chlorotica]|uniref:SH3 domain-containing protein n=1 Tax=Elysia chlorotica TaxID=188477 RepID=A0A3S0ZM57_ELYCH|nr:hypothetical protein EGW08_009990 [Elysia chlorotica]
MAVSTSTALMPTVPHKHNDLSWETIKPSTVKPSKVPDDSEHITAVLETSKIIRMSTLSVSSQGPQTHEHPQASALTPSPSLRVPAPTQGPAPGALEPPRPPSSNKAFAPAPSVKDSVPGIFEEFNTEQITTLIPTKTRKQSRTPTVMKSSVIQPSVVVSQAPLFTTALPSKPGGMSSTSPSTVPTFPGGPSNSTTGVGGTDHTSEIIIGSAVAVFLLAIVVLGTLLCLRWKRRRTKTPAINTDDLWMNSFDTNNHMMPLPSLTTCAPEMEVPVKNENIYTVAFPYQPLQDGHLSLHKGDKLRLVETADNGWWRGVSVKKGKSGWFPSSYVTAEDIASSENKTIGSNDEIFTPDEEENKQKTGLERQISSFQIKRMTDTEVVKENNTFAVIEEQENAKDVQGWVNMAASMSMMSLPTTELSYSTNLTDFTTAANGQRFRAVYAYKPVNRGEMGLREGELVTCQERDRNGWMLGRKTRSGEQGWFPAVYVDQVSSDDESICDPEIPDTYDLLDSNKLHKVDQTFVGIDHEVVLPFSSPVPGDLALVPGETVTVLQTLANGWWFGVKEQDCGWFPATFVEMAEDTTPAEAPDQHNQLTSKEVAALLLSGFSKSSYPEQQQITPKTASTHKSTNKKGSVSLQVNVAFRKHKSDDRLDSTSISSQNTVTELRPHRKAPPPPPASLRNSEAMSEAASDLGPQLDGTLRRPARRAPAPPVSKDARLTSKGSAEKLEVSSSQSKPPDMSIVLINGKRPKLQKITPDRLNEKHLNPMIRPSTRGFMARPTDSSKDIWESRPEKRLLERNNHRSNHSNRASSNLSSYLSSPVHGLDSPRLELDGTYLATGLPSPVSGSSLMSEKLVQSLTGQTFRQ